MRRAYLVGKDGLSRCLNRPRPRTRPGVVLMAPSCSYQRQVSFLSPLPKEQGHWLVGNYANIRPNNPEWSHHLRQRQWQERRAIDNTKISRAHFSTDSQIRLRTKRAPNKLSLEDERMINQLIKYKEAHGDCHIPTGKRKFVEEDRKQLGVSDELVQWVSQKRKLYNGWRARNLKIQEADQILFLVLESMGFMWSKREAQWQRYFNRLEAHKAKYGTLYVDKNKDPALWAWADIQRKILQRGKMKETRLDLLKEIGFAFDLQEAAWRQSYEKLCEHAKEHGTANFLTHSEEDPSLGGWVARQRRHYHMNKLSKERIRALESIGFTWDVRGEKWEDFYSELLAFHAKHGHTRVPVTAGPLWHWVDRQRRILRQQSLEEEGSSTESSDRIAALNKLNFDWSVAKQEEERRAKRLMDLMFSVDVYDERWDENYKKLCTFKERFGHFSIPKNSPEYRELASWVTRQRSLYKRERLPEKRIAALDKIGFVCSAQEARWGMLYQELVRFRAEHGHTRVPCKHRGLYHWIRQQRMALQDLDKGNNQLNEKDPQTMPKTDTRLLQLEKILLDEHN